MSNWQNFVFPNFSVGQLSMPSSGSSKRAHTTPYKGAPPRKKRRSNARSGCLTEQSYQCGKRVTTKTFDHKIIEASKEANIFRIYGLNSACSLTQSSGFFKLLSAQASAATTLYCPLILFDLTCLNQGVTSPISGYGLTFSNNTSTGQASFTQLPGWSAANYQWQAENIQDPSYDSRSLLGWVSGKFMFYAPSQVPVKVQIDLVQFPEEDVIPGGREPVAGAVPIVPTAANAFWQGMIKEYMWNPLEPGNKGLENKYIKYLQRDSFILDCKTTIENESTHFKKYDWYCKMNRLCNHTWDQQGQMGLADTSFETNTQQTIGTASPYVDPKSRVFLMVRAYSGYQGASAAFNAAYHPSFDLVLRKKVYTTA